jgi:hypothetical protein
VQTLEYVSVGEQRLKGLEIPKVMTVVYPQKLLGRLHSPTAATCRGWPSRQTGAFN